ncbi:uncharacterized protein [Asterias amurensis]|uniref:uncharacterized protein n=1 Tax=Asterias amurensis TaxID=7602 RepID=UPI003AB8E035
MFAHQSSKGRETLQCQLIKSTASNKALSASTTMEDILSITDNAHKTDTKGDDYCTTRLPTTKLESDATAIWATHQQDGYQSNPNPSGREFCGHTTCGERCLFQVYKTMPRQLEVSDENNFLTEGKQRLGDYPLSNHQREFEWETQMMNSPAEMQEGQLDEREGLPNDDVLDEIDFSLRQRVDREIEAFRASLHNMLEEQHQQYRQILTPENTLVRDQIGMDNSQLKDQEVFFETSSSKDVNFAWSPMNGSDQPQIEESSSSSYSMQDEEASQIYQPNKSGDDDIDGVLIQLMTSASIISHALRRREYAS